MKNKLYIILIVSLICILGVSTNDIYATNLSGDELLQVNGNTISKNTTITQINNMFGQPKLTTNSAFGGKAYTYYDDAYTWMLHIETNANGNIKGYGCINGNFISRRYAQGDKDTYTYSYMSGTVLADDNDLVNGVYEYNVTSSEVEEYKERFMQSSQYLYDLQKSSLIVSKILANKHGYYFPQTYINEDIFYMNEELKDNNTDIYTWAKDTGKTKYISLVLSRPDSCYYELPNPIMLGKNTENYTRAENYNYIFYDIKVQDEQNFTLFTTILFIDPDFMDEKEEVSLTDTELSLLEALRAKYKEYNEHGQAITANFDIEPQYEELPLVAGKWTDMALLMVTDYINLARVGAGLQPLKLNSDIADAAQHKATLVVYNNIKGYTSGHNPEQPDGVSDEFYDKAQSYMTENLYTGDIQSSIVGALNDAYGDPVSCGHRYNLLDPSATEWGIGAVGSGLSWGWQSAQKFSGFEDYSNELVAWPSNGIFTMDLAYNGIGNWTARFYKRYTVSSDTEVTIKALNSGKVYEITNENKNNNGKFLENVSNRQITFRDDTITYESGDVFEITLHNVKDETNGKNIDYTYRSVFYSFKDISADEVTDIQINNQNVSLGVGQTSQIEAKVLPESAIDKMIIYSSTNTDVITIRQDGLITAIGEGQAQINILCGNVLKTINVIVTPYQKGDVNKDGAINSIDASMVIDMYKNNNTITQEELNIADMNNDQSINSVDASMIIDMYKNNE